MVVERTADYVIAAKTGWAQGVHPQIGWYVGYVERHDTVWIFAMNLDIEKKRDAEFRREITLEAFKSERHFVIEHVFTVSLRALRAYMPADAPQGDWIWRL